MDWGGVDGVAAAHVALPSLIEVYYGDEEDDDDEVRRRSFSSGMNAVDRVGLETDFLPVKRLPYGRTLPARPPQGASSAQAFGRLSIKVGPHDITMPPLPPDAAAADATSASMSQLREALQPRAATTLVPVPRRATAEELPSRRVAFAEQLRDPSASSLGAAQEALWQARREAVSLDDRCYQALLNVYALHNATADDCLDVVDHMDCDGVRCSPDMLLILVRQCCSSTETLASAVALVVDSTSCGCSSADPSPFAAAIELASTAVSDHVVRMVAALSTEALPRRCPYPPYTLTDAMSKLMELRRRCPSFELTAAERVMEAAIAVLDTRDIATGIACLDQQLAAALDAPLLAHLGSKLLSWMALLLLEKSTDAVQERRDRRVAIVTRAAEQEWPLDSAAYVALLQGCTIDQDVHGLAFLVGHLRAHRVLDNRVVQAALDAMRERDLPGAARVMWDYVRDVFQLETSGTDEASVSPGAVLSPPGGAVIDVCEGLTLTKLSDLAVDDGDCELVVQLVSVVCRGPAARVVDPADHRYLLRNVARVIEPSRKTVNIQECFTQVASLRTEVWRVFLRGLKQREELVDCMSSSPLGAAEPRNITTAAEPVFAPSTIQLLLDRPNATLSTSYVLVLDVSAWVSLAQAPSAAAAVSRLLTSAYEKGGGGILLVGMETVLGAMDDTAMSDETAPADPRRQRAAVALLLAEWVRAPWFHLVPLDVAVALRGRCQLLEMQGAKPTVSTWWAVQWASALRAAGFVKVACLTGTDAGKQDIMVGGGWSPVVTVRELVAKFSGGR